jgi:hypothetical protein
MSVRAAWRTSSCAIRARARRLVALLRHSASPSPATEPRPMDRAHRRRSTRRVATLRSSPSRQTSARLQSLPPRRGFSFGTPAQVRTPRACPRRSQPSRALPHAVPPHICHPEGGVRPRDLLFLGIRGTAIARDNSKSARLNLSQSGRRKTRSAASSAAQGWGKSRNDSHSCLKISACT